MYRAGGQTCEISGMTTANPHASAIATSLRRLFFLDFAVTVAHASFWVMMQLVTPMVAALTCGLRVLAWMLYARQSIAPVRAWLARRDASLLHEAHAAINGFGRRVARMHLLGWLLLDAAWLLLAFAGFPVELPVGSGEMVSAALLTASLLVAPFLVEPAADSSLLEIHTAIRAELGDERLEVDAEVQSITHVVTRLVVFGFIATTVGLSGASMSVHTQRIRQLEVAEQRRLAEVGALQTELGLEPVGVEIVERSGLPGPLVAELDRPAESGSIAVHDARGELSYAAAPLADGRWVVAIGRPDEELGASVIVVIGLLIVITPVFGVSAWTYARSITQPLDRFADMMARFSSHGELRGLSRAIPVQANEVGRLSINFNRMLDTLEELADAAKAVANGELNVQIGRAGELHDAFRGMLARLNEIVGRMRETALEVASAAAEIQALTQQQHGAAQQQSSGVQQISATIVSLAEAAQSIAVTAHGVLDNAEQTVATTDEMVEKIAALRAHAASVTALLEVIRDIADRSDLLALNGSLEATRAGEAGRGFALVAAEMRRLAERVTQTVADVRTQVTDIESSGSNTVLATEQSRTLAQATAVAARRISTVTEQQSKDTKDVALGMRELAQVALASTAAASQTHAAAEGLRAHANELERLLATFRTVETEAS